MNPFKTMWVSLINGMSRISKRHFTVIVGILVITTIALVLHSGNVSYLSTTDSAPTQLYNLLEEKSWISRVKFAKSECTAGW